MYNQEIDDEMNREKKSRNYENSKHGDVEGKDVKEDEIFETEQPVEMEEEEPMVDEAKTLNVDQEEPEVSAEAEAENAEEGAVEGAVVEENSGEN